MPHCKQACIERCPISNLLLGYKQDLRNSSTPLLLSLGYPVSISPDDPGKFGYEDTTGDYFAVATAYNWTLRHLKLVAYHSINHAICDESIKSRLIHLFDAAWNTWVQTFLKSQGIPECSLALHQEKEGEVFAANLHWSFSGE
jgi:adenosine deaminase